MPLDQIEVIDRLRPVDPDHVEVQAASMGARGLDQAIVIRPHGDRFRLVAGLHRLTAAQQLGWPTIRAEIRRLSDDEARLIEIDENLVRRELDALDQALFLHARRQTWERLHPETKKGNPVKKAEAQSLRLSLGLAVLPTFSAEAAEKTGLSQRAIQVAMKLGEDLAPEAIRHLRETKLTDNASALRQIAKEAPGMQVRVAQMIASGEAGGLAEARERLGLSLPAGPAAQADPEHVRKVLFSQFVDAFEATGGDPELRARCVAYLRQSGVRV